MLLISVLGSTRVISRNAAAGCGRHGRPLSRNEINWFLKTRFKTNKRRTARAMVHSNAPYYLSICGIFVPVCLVCTVIFLVRRNVQPIKARLPWVVAAQALMLAFHNGALGLGFSADGPRVCWVQNLVGHACFIGLAFIYTCRAWNLHLQHYLTGSATLFLCFAGPASPCSQLLHSLRHYVRPRIMRSAPRCCGQLDRSRRRRLAAHVCPLPHLAQL